MILPASIPSPDESYWVLGEPVRILNWEFGPLTIHFYALCILVGVVCAWIWTGRRIAKRGGDRAVALDFTVWALVLGIVGARLYHVVTHWGDYFGTGEPFWVAFYNALAFWQGGIAIFGALLGGALGVLLASRLTGVKFSAFADALVPGLLLAQAFGRLGNWFNHELFGGPTTLPWGLEIESSNPAFPVGLPEGTLFHPTFLYEIVWNLLGIVVLLAIERRWQPRWGRFFGLYLIWYGLGRAVIESLRVDPSLLFLGLRTNVLAALLAVVLGIVIIIVQGRRHPGIETSIHLPGRANPIDEVLDEHRASDRFYRVTEVAEADASETPIAEPEAEPEAESANARSGE
ncbi:prolipoprotein diacylglyceryl transferase [Leucobacter sp. GX24907]